MAFRCGSHGESMWKQCLRHGVAAIYYGAMRDTDLAQHSRSEPQALWAGLKPTQRASLRRLAFDMKKGDVILAKEGRFIVAEGVVSGPYRYDRQGKIRDHKDQPWNHHRPVKWKAFAPPVQFVFRADLITVYRPNADRLREFAATCAALQRKQTTAEVAEGQKYRAEVLFRKRNRAIIAMKKVLSDGRCEACGMSFGASYGLDASLLVAHHTNPIGRRSKATATTLEDLELLCPNCHAVAHTSDPPLSKAAIGRMSKTR
jgi:5-methylcytosine-specific restriction endonuclease McrA